MCRFDMAPNKTNSAIGTKSIRITTTKSTKKGFTVALAANGAGEKLLALIIFKEKGRKLGPRVSKSLSFPANAWVTATTNGWMTSPMYNWWLNNLYGYDQQRRLLIVDKYKSHTVEDNMRTVKINCNSDLLFIPAGCTPLVQPMDVSINRPFKNKMQEIWVAWFSTHTEQTTQGNLKKPTRQRVIDLVSAAWENVNPQTIVQSFMLCGITAHIDGYDNDKMFQHIPQQLWKK